MKSMTGYGEAAQNTRTARITVQIRSLNHRHLDLQLRVPREYLPFEEEIRKDIRAKISRGRIDLFVNRYAPKSHARRLEMNEALVGQYIAGVRQLKKKFKLAGEVDVSLLADIPDLVHVREPEIDAAAERAAALKALAGALKKLDQAREREGAHLRADMEEQIDSLKRVARELETHAAENGARLAKTGSLQEGQCIAAGDKTAEVGGAMLKGDINEELVRLKTHIGSLARVVRERGPVGKRIDFVLQEVNRELNTISSKVPQLTVVQLVLQGKERAEKIREQTQNIE